MSQQINLFNPIFLKQKKYFSAAAMLQAFALLLAGIAVLYGFALRQTQVYESLLSEATREATQRRSQLVAFGQQYSDRGASKQLEDDIQRLETQLRRREALLREITTSVGGGNVAGYSPYLAALARQTTKGVWLTGVDIGSKSADLVIRGRALDENLVPVYLRALSKEPEFAGRKLSALQIAARESAVQAAGAPKPAPEAPVRFVEFMLSMPLGQPAATARKGVS